MNFCDIFFTEFVGDNTNPTDKTINDKIEMHKH